MTDEPPHVAVETIVAETEALKALEFYENNYTRLVFRNLGSENNKQIVLGSKPFKCRFCNGKPPEKTFKKRAHAVSELLGNKIMVSLYECDDCNERFSKSEDDLSKMTLPMRNLGGVIGKRGVPTLVSPGAGVARKARMEFKDGTPHLSHEAGDSSVVVDELARTITFSYVEQPYRPLGAYKALCKSAFTLLPQEELANFEELRKWLSEEDLTTGQVYSDGSHICYETFVDGFRPFRQPIVILLRRNTAVDASYMSFFIAFGNVSYQIFLPFSSKDEYLLGKEIEFPPFPHLFQLQPRLDPGPVWSRVVDLSSRERTKSCTKKITWGYEQKV